MGNRFLEIKTNSFNKSLNEKGIYLEQNHLNELNKTMKENDLNMDDVYVRGEVIV